MGCGIEIDPTVLRNFKREMRGRMSLELNVMIRSLSVEEYKPSKDFRTEVLQSLGVGHYEPGTSLRLESSEGGDRTEHPWSWMGLLLEFHNRNQARFRKLTFGVSLTRFGSEYKIRGTVGWSLPLRVKYETRHFLKYPFSPSDKKQFDEHWSRMELTFITTAKRSL